MESTPNAFQSRTCWICEQPIVELKKASGVDVGVGQELPAHDLCVQGLAQAMEDEKAVADEDEASFMRKAQDEVNMELLKYALNKGIVKEVK